MSSPTEPFVFLNGIGSCHCSGQAEALPSNGMVSGVLSPWHIAIFVLVVLLVFGPKRLPEMGRSLGKGMREFKDSITTQEPEQPSLPRTEAAAGDRDTLG